MATGTLEAPAAAPPSTAAPAASPGAGQPAEAAKTTISASQLPGTATPAATPKPGSARERMFEELRKKAKGGEQEETPKAKPQIPSKVQTAAAEGTEGTEGTEEAGPAKAGTPSEEAQTVLDEKAGKKPSPWKLMDQWKERAIKAEARAMEIEKGAVPAEEKKGYLDRIQQYEARVKGLEDEMRYVNYSKSEEFKTKYQEPYDKAWQRAANEIKEITLEDPQTGQRRPVTPTDLLELVNLPLGNARDLADQLYGKFADDVMAHRKEIRHLFEQQQTALEEAKTKGAEREKLRAEQWQKTAGEIQKHVGSLWQRSNELATVDEKYGKFFKPVEGDQDGNQRLAKGFDLVDRALAENPMNPQLTPEERSNVVRRHAAVRNRAAAFGRLVQQVSKLEAEKAEIMKELEQYKTVEPGGGSGGPAPVNGTSSAREQVFGALRKMAK